VASAATGQAELCPDGRWPATGVTAVGPGDALPPVVLPDGRGEVVVAPGVDVAVAGLAVVRAGVPVTLPPGRFPGGGNVFGAG
jgi:hypothetical protein